jgi:HEAT repeat protein
LITTYRKIFYLLAFLLLAGCQSKDDQSVNKFSDPVLIKIADLKDRRMADSLYTYFNHEDASYRREAVMAFGSIQRVEDIDKIGKLLLMDADAAVRKAAAFALGQLGDPASERILLGAVVKEKVPENVYEILQAYGKVTANWNLNPENFTADSLKSAGLAWSIYRAGLRDKSNERANGVAIQLLGQRFQTSARLGAAHYFARGAKDFPEAGPALGQTATSDTSPEVRMAAALALGKIATDSSLQTLKSVIKTDSDTRVVISAIRALRGFKYDRVKHYLYEALLHKDPHVGIASSEIILEILPQDEWIEVSSLINQVDHWRIAANLYESRPEAIKIWQKRFRKDTRARTMLLNKPGCWDHSSTMRPHPRSWRLNCEKRTQQWSARRQRRRWQR